MKTTFEDSLNEDVDYSEFIYNNELTIDSTQIDLKDLAIEKYKDLTCIIIYNCTVLNQDIDFSIFQNLKEFNCHTNQLTTLPDLSKCSQLKELYCYHNQLTSLPDLANCSQLQYLYCDNNQLTTLPDLSKCSQLEYLYCDNNQLTSLPNLSNCSQLNTLDCFNNQLTSLSDLNNYSQLKELDCHNNRLTSCKSFYKIGVGNVTFSNNPIPQIEVEFVKNVNGINDYYFDLFNYCVDNDISMKDFLNIEWSEDFYNTYIKKIKSPTQKRFIEYLNHNVDFNDAEEDLFNF